MAVNAYYASGTVAVLSTKLWTKERFIRLAESVNLDVAVRSLVESGYGGGVSVDNSNNYEEILQRELASSIAFLQDMTSNKSVSDCFLLKYDYINAKVMMKCKYMREEPQNLYECGTIDSKTMWQCISVDDYQTLYEPMQWALNAIDLEFVNGNRSPSVIDKYLDRALFKDLFRRTRFCPLASIKKYFKMSADVANITCYYRLKRAGIEITEDCFADGGSVKPKRLAETQGDISSLFDEELALVAKKAENDLSDATNYAEKLKREALISGKDNFTVEPVICYFLSKLTEIDNIRTILICVKNNVDKDLVKEKVKELYV